MPEIPLEFYNKLASQTMFISALMGGFSLAVIVTLLETESSDEVLIKVFKAAIISAASFLISIVAMTKVWAMTTSGFPLPISGDDTLIPRLIGLVFFVVGLISLVFIIIFSGRTKSKKLGKFTTIVGIISLIFMLSMMIGVG